MQRKKKFHGVVIILFKAKEKRAMHIEVIQLLLCVVKNYELQKIWYNLAIRPDFWLLFGGYYVFQNIFPHATAVFISFSKPAAIITANHPKHRCNWVEWFPQGHAHSHKRDSSKPEGSVLQGHQTSCIERKAIFWRAKSSIMNIILLCLYLPTSQLLSFQMFQFSLYLFSNVPNVLWFILTFSAYKINSDKLITAFIEEKE